MLAMAAQPFPEPRTWAEDNFAATELGDKRRTRRLVETAAQLAQQPEGSLPEHSSWNPLRAVYRLCNRPEVTHSAVTATHFRLTRRRMEQANTAILILHDTTELNFTSHHALEGTGPVGNGQGRGFLQHNSLAIEADTRKILGLAFQQVTTRRPAPKAETHTARQSRPRESQLWEQGIRGVGTAPARACWVDVADRGADSFEAMKAALDQGHQFLFRACKDRKVATGPTADGPRRLLKSWARSLPSRAQGEVTIAEQGGRPERTARVRMAAGRAWFPVPRLVHGVHPDWVAMRVWVERVWEPHPPTDVEEPLEWILLSSLPASGPEELARHRDRYAGRPMIEDFHQVEKSGCGEEDLRFQTAEALLPMLGVLAIVAVRVLQLRWWGRDGAESPASSASTAEERQALKSLGQRIKTAGDFVRAVARLGGFLSRSGDGEPGWQTLWRGYRRLQDIVLGMQLKAGRVPSDFREHHNMLMSPL
jgi:Transposase DNA-binding/Transposase Tn5 dimerisation domain